MPEGFWGRKLGMTQLFDGDKVLPVTAIDVAHWFVTGVKTSERDGYNALCVGLVRKRYADQQFSSDWLKASKRYFMIVRELKTNEAADPELVGKPFNPCDHAAMGDQFDVRRAQYSKTPSFVGKRNGSH